MNTNLNIKIGTKPLLLLWGIKNDLLPVSGILVLPSYSTSWNGSGLRKSWPWNFEPCCVSKLAKTIWICACLPQTSSTHQTSQGHFVKCQLWGTWTPQIKITNVRSEYILRWQRKLLNHTCRRDMIRYESTDEESRSHSDNSSYRVVEGGRSPLARAPPEVERKGVIAETKRSIDFWASPA
jgi:hypothetical protein